MPAHPTRDDIQLLSPAFHHDPFLPRPERTPLEDLNRGATCDTELRGQQIRKGDKRLPRFGPGSRGEFEQRILA